MVRRAGMDSIPKLRRAILDHLAGTLRPSTTSSVAVAVEHPSRTTRRGLEDLAAHGMVTRDAGGQGAADAWSLSTRAAGWLARATLPETSDTMHDAPSPFYTPNNSSHVIDDITGKVGEAEAKAVPGCPACQRLAEEVPGAVCSRHFRGAR